MVHFGHTKSCAEKVAACRISSKEVTAPQLRGVKNKPLTHFAIEIDKKFPVGWI